MQLTTEIIERLKQIDEKYSVLGQDMTAYLDGLLYSNSLTYWDYIHVDTLLSLQTPRTDFPDEVIFICYHQITELYFKLVLHEITQLQAEFQDKEKRFLRLGRINNYFRHLAHSFDVMASGMEPEQFLKFRMALLPASGFQSVQYRLIELHITALYNLVQADVRSQFQQSTAINELYPHIYWKYGNIEERSGKKTLTLQMFEHKYDEMLQKLVVAQQHNNLRALYLALPESERNDERLIKELKRLDLSANVFWRLSHYKTVVHYMQRDPEDIKATGGTNWQKFLPPRFQKIIFFPELWTEVEKAEWGKAWVVQLFEEEIESSWRK